MSAVAKASAETVTINWQVRIPLSELRFTFSRSSGPGGQNINKVSTRVTLFFNVAATPSLTAAQRRRVVSKLHTRIDSRGMLRVVCSRHRTQRANRQAAVERFAALLAEALAPRKPRIKTRVPRIAVVRRLVGKARRSETKRQRRYRPSSDD